MGKRRDDLAARIDAIYREATGAEHQRGWNQWFAGLARVHPLTVSRAISGDRPPDRIEAILDAIELGRQLGPRKSKRGG